MPFNPAWLVVQKRETESVEVVGFEQEEDARAHYDLIHPNWTETYLCKVMKGPLT